MLHSSKDEGNDEEECHPLVESAGGSAQIKSLRRFPSLPPAAEYMDLYNFSTSISPSCKWNKGLCSEVTLLAAAREEIGLKQVKFYGGIRFDDNEKQYLTVNPDEPVYVGPPTPEMDDAWQALPIRFISEDEDIAVTPEEAKEVSDRSAYDKYRGHYTVGLDILHSLHCLNAIRIAQDVDYYRAQGFHEEWWARFHIDHCINHLRQVIQCHGDLTPAPLVPASRYASKKGWIMPDFDVVHTYRDFKAIREWSTEKHESGIRKARLAAQKQNLSD
ncbi:putative tat pathway signal sequence protein [Botrytis fragariae]|uniref:Putative tat pathway signal sequence protein n=1 Tax=Botrytis fragariae TaxID=1964551 RepID=A0A8H6EJ07_9HELO|nr:putative tat pathway signal sequence protein [Botrytis fragariae]KAF5874021.1 putative tat pathway signal sequence protein [Botrytis fragariae]